MPVNVVLVGYGGGQVDERALRASLPVLNKPVARTASYAYGITDEVGITYTYDYRVQRASRAFEDRFFGFLRSHSTSMPLTEYQDDYNAQDANSRVVQDNVEISAPLVERWLGDHAPPGVDTRQNTVFLVNWFGRKDFRDHVYVKEGVRDPDTGTDFGKRQSRKIIAWGGTAAQDEEARRGRARRVWFHDISAGPEAWAGSWNVDDPDLDGDDQPDYRIPPIWEYGHYRPASALTADLGLLLRYVAIDSLFTSAPLYPAELPVSDPARTVNVDSNTYEGWPGVDASQRYVDPRVVLKELQKVTPLQ